jgi:hypothetical protein
MLQMFSRYEFEKAVQDTKTERHSRGFSSWNHFVSMLSDSFLARTACGELKQGSPLKRVLFIISEFGWRIAQPWPMPIVTALMSFFKKSSPRCCPNVSR